MSSFFDKIMNIDFTNISIKLLLINSVLASIGIIQKVLNINLLPDSIEAFAFALLLCFEIYVVTFYFIAIVSELRKIASALSRKD